VETHKVEIDAAHVKDFNKGIIALDKNNPEKAVILFKRLTKHLNVKEVWMNLGIAYKALNNYDKVRECFEKACNPDVPFSDGKYVDIWPLGFSNLGLLYYALEEDDLAIELYKLALRKDPVYYDAIWNLSLASLRKLCSNKPVDANLAWEYYSWRFKRTKAAALKNSKKDLVFWNFKDAYLDEDIIILTEQGMGDAMMFGRYLSLIEQKFRRVYVQCTPELDYLFKYPCRDGIDTSARFAVPIASLAKTVDYIPAGNWLSSKYVPKVGGATNIMCVWAGNSDHTNNHNRSTYPGYFDRLAKYGNLHSVVPRKGYTHMEIVDWEATIKYLEGIDIVVTIDSSMAHLCGSLGKPCIVLMPLFDSDFRWGDSSMGTKNVWYDSVKVIRNDNNWEKVFDSVERELSAWVQLPSSWTA
jgi:tetratricopeptide (TPR) repeat protein